MVKYSRVVDLCAPYIEALLAPPLFSVKKEGAKSVLAVEPPQLAEGPIGSLRFQLSERCAARGSQSVTTDMNL